MASNKIISEKELNYIETLYVYANLEDFLIRDTGYIDDARNLFMLDDVTDTTILEKQSHELYSDNLEYIYDTMLHDAKYLGSAKGRSWYELDNYRLGIMDFMTAKKSNQFNVEIQYTQAHMFSLDEKLKGLDLPFDGTFDNYHIKRIDVSQIVKTPCDYLTNHGFISSFRKIHKEGTSLETQTIYLGHRKNGNVFRMYNKTIELLKDDESHPIDHKKIELFSKYFGDIENLYTFELELHRKHLKPNFNIDTLDDLDKVYQVYYEVVGKIRIYEDNDINRKLVKNKHHDRIKDLLYFTDYKEFKRVNQKRYKPSKYYAIDRAVRAVESYEKSMGNLTEANKILMLDEIANRLIGKDIDIHVGSDCYDEMKDKHERIRNSEDNSLAVEAKRAFKKVQFNKNPFIE